MNGELHHLILLLAYANMTLINNVIKEPEKYKDQNHYLVKFQSAAKKRILSFLSSASTEQDTTSWMKCLKERKCKGVLLINFNKGNDERISSGGRRWGIICCFENATELWIGNWRVEREPPDTRWEIIYRRIDSNIDTSMLNKPINLDELTKRLDEALKNISQLAEEIQEDYWKNNFFDIGIQILEGTNIKENQLPNIYSMKSQRIINAVYSSWVFGGMGSWNDSPPYSAHEKGKEHEFNKYSNTLYETMMDCIEGAVNSIVSQR